MKQLLSTKRVVKNTVFLYGRMLFSMIISLLTSRVLLNALGVEDFGIYNVVAGVVVLFAFLQAAFSSSSTRFIGVAITEDEESNKIVSEAYSSAFILHIILILVLVLVLETAGLWYIDNYLNIPKERISESVVVFHLAVLNICIQTIRVPNYSVVVAFEKMSFFAICGIAEALLKLLIAYLIIASPYDRLISYSILMVVVNMIMNVSFHIYTHYFLTTKIRFTHPRKKMVKGMVSLIGWNSLGGIANIGYQQGIGLLVNFFFGVTLNAALGIANQVKNAVYSFVSNIRVASDPQIIKSYALSEFSYCAQLMSRITRLSHYLLLLIIIPIIVNIDFILHLWLKNPPTYASSFVVLMLLYCMLDGLMGPLWIINQATGKIKKYQIIRSLFYFSNIPIAFIVIKYFPIPELTIIIGLLLTSLLYLIQIPICVKPIKMSIRDYFRDVLLPVLLVSLITSAIVYLSSFLIEGPWVKLVLTTIVNTVVLAVTVVGIGLTSTERTLAVGYANSLLKKSV